MDKRALVDQLEHHLRAVMREAQRTSSAAAEEARAGATARERRADTRVAIENAGLARGHKRRAQRAETELRALEGFVPRELSKTAAIDIGAIVEIEDEDSGEGRTLFMAPAGAGATLTGPGGDGLFSVVTPSSPIGKALRRRRVGEVVSITVRGEVREWLITWVA
jgi:transcription elongation GreA/GreB family factor